MNISIQCTGNSYTSQMAQDFLQSFDKNIEVQSAGIFPASKVNPRAFTVMGEVGIEISKNSPKSVDDFLNDQWGYVISACDDANKTCPFFSWVVEHHLHFGFKDPSHTTGPDEFIMSEFRRIRDEIRSAFYKFYYDFLI
jgi:arsenate reductase